MIYDVVIIGGGLAGLSLSIDLKERGHYVCVIEKGSYPRHKVCGEYISNESFHYLHHLCPELCLEKLPQIKKFRLSSTGNFSFTTELKPGGFGISRYLLEQKLSERAIKLGVHFLLNTRYKNVEKKENVFLINHSGGQTAAKLVCNCSGRYTGWENGNGKSKYIAIKYHVKTKRDAALIEIHNFPGGYCGVSNIENDLSCLCYIIKSEKLRASGKSIKEMEKTVLFKNKNLRRLFTESDFLYQEPLSVSGISFRAKYPVKDEIFYLGDASGTIAPITGNGMSNALRAACYLSGYIDAYFKNKINFNDLKNIYSKQWNENFSARINLSRYFQKLSEYLLPCKLTIGALILMPFLAAMIIRKTHGEEFGHRRERFY